MANNVRKLQAKIREEKLHQIYQFLADSGEDVGYSKSNQVLFPVVDEEGGEWFCTVTVAIPTGSRDGEPFDGYALREEYQLKKDKK